LRAALQILSQALTSHQFQHSSQRRLWAQLLVTQDLNFSHLKQSQESK
jgi:hypothetical protein